MKVITLLAGLLTCTALVCGGLAPVPSHDVNTAPTTTSIATVDTLSSPHADALA